MKKRLFSAALAAVMVAGSMLSAGAAGTLKDAIIGGGKNPTPVLTVPTDIVAKTTGEAESSYADSANVYTSSLPAKFDFRASVDMANVRSKFASYVQFAKDEGFTDAEIDAEAVTGKFTINVTYPKSITLPASFTGGTAMEGFSNKADSAFEEISRNLDESDTSVNKLTIEIKVKSGINATALAADSNKYLQDFYLECTEAEAASYGTYQVGGTVEGFTHVGTVSDPMDGSLTGSVGTIKYLFRQKETPQGSSTPIEPASVTVQSRGSGSSSSTSTVTINTDGGSSVPAIKVKPGSTINIDNIAKPTKEGYEFGGYYFDKECTKKATGMVKITGNTVLYTKWIEKTEEDAATVKINVGGKSGVVEDVKVNPGEKLDVSKLPVPEKEGFVFAGYYTDPELKEKAEGELEITKDTTLYARMVNTTPAKDLNSDDHFAYINGYPDGEVKPFANISREEVATIFFRLLSVVRRGEITAGAVSFNDMTDDRWSKEAVDVMAAGGYINGYPEGDFRPEGAITRAEFVTIASRFTDEAADDGEYFNDISGHWAEKYIRTAANNAWLDGSNTGSFRPDDYITRADAIRIVNRMLVRYVNDDGITENAKQWPDNSEDSAYYYDILEATNSHDYDKQEDGYNDLWKDVK